MSNALASTDTTQNSSDEIGKRGLTPLERLETLCDPRSLELIRSGVRSPGTDSGARLGDGVVGGLGRIDGRPIACFAQDVRVAGGSLGVAHAESIVRVLQLAERLRVPVVSFAESGGARMQEGVAALSGYSRVFRQNVLLSKIVPQISVIGGIAAGGACYSPALTDFVVMTESAAMFLTGPTVVQEVVGEKVSAADLGGHQVHAQNGVCDFVTGSDQAAAKLVRSLLSYLPQFAGADLPLAMATESELSDPGEGVPQSPRRVYDVRTALGGIVDANSLLEVAPRWARSIFTGFARLEGRSAGVIANQPRYLGGVLNSESSQKGARFAETCDRFGIPIVVLVDTPGFMPGIKQEKAGVIRHGAALVRAFAKATVPRITIVLRKAYGGAFIAMNSRDLGADMVFAWKGAEIGVMGAQAAIAILHRRDLAAIPDRESRREALAEAYAKEHLSADAAAAGGFVDEVIVPQETRARLVGALQAMENYAE